LSSSRTFFVAALLFFVHAGSGVVGAWFRTFLDLLPPPVFIPLSRGKEQHNFPFFHPLFCPPPSKGCLRTSSSGEALFFKKQPINLLSPHSPSGFPFLQLFSNPCYFLTRVMLLILFFPLFPAISSIYSSSEPFLVTLHLIIGWRVLTPPPTPISTCSNLSLLSFALPTNFNSS